MTFLASQFASARFKYFSCIRFLVLISICFFNVNTAAAVAPLSVNGSQIQVGGQTKGLAGNSYFWSNEGWGAERFYNADVVAWLKNDWQSNIVRAAMGVEDQGAYLQNPSANKERVKTVVDAAIAQDMYVIIDWHSHHAEDYQNQAIEFFTEMAQTYGQNNNVIYEIYNEPLQVSWSNTIKPYAEAVIAAIRAVDPDNLIVVGTPTWSQDVDQAAADPITAYDNIAYTLHFYAGTHKASLRDKAERAMDAGIALMVTEWGSVNASGDGAVDVAETNAWVNWMQQYNLTHLNWSINDKAEGASILNPGAASSGGWAASDLTQSGNLVRGIIRDYNSDGDGGGNSDGGTSYACESATTLSLPGLVQAENFCEHSGIRTQATEDAGGGDNIGWVENGDWVDYKVNASTRGTFVFELRVATERAGGRIEVLSGTTKLGDISLPATGGWQSWQSEFLELELNSGEQVLRLNFIGGDGSLLNVNWFKVAEGNTNEGSDDNGSDNDDPTGSSVVSCEFLIENEWSSGFVGEIKVTNNGTEAIIQDWSLSFQFNDGSSFLSGWNGDFSGANPYTITPLSWNKTIPAGASVSFGLQASKAANNAPAPTPPVTGSICG